MPDHYHKPGAFRTDRTACGWGLLLAVLLPSCAPALRLGPAAESHPLAMRVEVVRTRYGVPHIYADDFRALGYALGYLQLEDYGEQVALGMLRARGELARYRGAGSLDSDFGNRGGYLRAVEVYPLLEQETRDVYEGFAAGVSRYVQLHPDEFPSWMPSRFTGYDVAALYFYRPDAGEIERWRRRLTGAGSADAELRPEAGAGSSAWALAPSRTVSGAGILMRNPHLTWDAGYWEVHVVVPGRLDFYGDFRIGGPLGIIGGFNRHLGFATTNNDVSGSEVYALELDPQQTGHYLLDGVSHPIDRTALTLPYAEGDGYVTETRVQLSTPYGPVIHQDGERVYVLRAAGDGAFRGGEQFLRLIQARSLDEWKNAMRLGGHPVSNFVYADADGNIFYIWNAAIPVRPHPPGGDAVVPVTRADEIWSVLHDLDSLPQLLNPQGGYVRNDNDGPWLTNLHQPLDPADYPAYFEGGSLSLRSQHSLLLIDANQRVSLEDVVALKHSDRMLLADRVKADLIGAVRKLVADDRAESNLEISRAVEVLEAWDNRAGTESRGAVLFEAWWRLYESALGNRQAYAEPWNDAAPTETPRGLAEPELAAEAFREAVVQTTVQFGSPDVAWGEVHRVRRGGVDEPVAGCAGDLGCFRVLNFDTDVDGRRAVTGGDGWVLAVEFTDPPRALSILGYGESRRPDSPHYADQAALFAAGRLKPVAFTREDVERDAVRRYRPGLETPMETAR